MPDDKLDIDIYDGVVLHKDDFEEELDAAGPRLYRGWQLDAITLPQTGRTSFTR